MTAEHAKAIQEMAKTTSKAIEAGEKSGKYLTSILGDGFKELGGAFHDWTQSYRYKNYLKLSDQIEEIHQKRMALGKPIPLTPKYALPILENASLEDSEVVQAMWAGLIANSTDPSVEFQMKKLYIEILSSLDPIDASIINYLGSNDLEKDYNFFNGQKLNVIEIASLAGVSEDDAAISLSNLFRHGLIIDSWSETIGSIDRGYSGFRVKNQESSYRLSHLGITLFNACNIT